MLRPAGVRAHRAPGLHDRAHRPDHDRAGPADVRRGHARAPGRSCSGRRSAGRRPPAAWSGRSWTCSCRRSRARPRSRVAGRRATTTSRSRPPSTSHACPTARRRWRSTSTASSTTAATTARCRSCLIPWSRSVGFRHAGRGVAGDDRALLPDGGWVRAARRHARRAASAGGLERAPRRPSTRRVRGAAGGAQTCLSRSSSWSTRCSTRATRSTRTRRARPRTRPRRRSGSSTRRPTRPERRARSTTCSCGACVEPGAGAARGRGALPAGHGRRATGRRRGDRAAAGCGGRPRRRPRSSTPSAGDGGSASRCGCAAELADGRSRWRCGSRTARRASRASTGPGRCAQSLLSTHPCCASRGGRFVSPLERTGVRERQHLAGAGHRRPTTSCSARRSCCPTTPRSRPRAAAACSTDRDRGGAAAARAGAERRRARGDRRRGSGGARDDRARRGGDARGDLGLHGRVTMRDRDRRRVAAEPPPACRRSAGESEAVVDGVTLPARRPRRPAPGARRRPARPDAGRPQGDDRADLRRLRRQAPPRRDRRRRPRPGADARDRPATCSSSPPRWR